MLLLDPVKLAEGQEVQITILSERDRVRKILGDLVVQYDEDIAISSDDNIDEDALLAEIHEATKGMPSVSDLIIEERREGP
ncbi:MAG: DUF104 domain-containing protein [Anaerolineae bacterium]|nr:DUF104 domain-containing protein [Anaerolineae bacterium]